MNEWKTDSPIGHEKFEVSNQKLLNSKFKCFAIGVELTQLNAMSHIRYYDSITIDSTAFWAIMILGHG